MSAAKCSCDKFGRLEGASVNAYAAAFLEDLGAEGAAPKNRLRCRACGSLWEKRPPDPEAKTARPSLVKISSQ